ncbi:MAG: peptide deformylase [Kiritimatiellaeota bacterium]|nr:peptide deformylase [Kiritimatiellota bacterium]
MKLTIRNYGDPILRQQAWPVAKVDEELRQLARDMIATMRARQGVGLAACQIGRREALCTIEIPASYDTDEATQTRWHPDLVMPWVLFNPAAIQSSEAEAISEEGCLSFPDIVAPISRPVEITLRYLDLEGRPQERVVRKFLARVVQHELDHLAGQLIVDRMSSLKKIALRGQLRRLKQDTEAELG